MKYLEDEFKKYERLIYIYIYIYIRIPVTQLIDNLFNVNNSEDGCLYVEFLSFNTCRNEWEGVVMDRNLYKKIKMESPDV